jgi:hypothetical protein
MRSVALTAADEALVVLNEAPWDSDNALHANTWACMLFPCVRWALCGQTSADSEAVFLRGLRSAFDQPSGPQKPAAINPVRLLSGLDPILKKVPRNILAATIQEGSNINEPAVRAICRFIQSLAELLSGDQRGTGKR